MKKSKKIKVSARQAKKGGKEITTTSVAFKTELLNGVKAHALHSEKRLSVSWITNQLFAKFLAGETVIEYP